MARRSISGLPPQYAKNAGGASASGYWLKLYIVGTTTPKLMYTIDIGGSSLVKCKLNTRGETISNSSDDDSVFVPYVDGPYKAILYATEADADADNTANALWTCDNIDNTSSTGYQTIVAAEFATVSTLVSGTPINALGPIDWSDYEGREVNVVVNNATSKAGGAQYIIKTVAQAASDGDVIDGTGAPNYYGANHALTGGTHVSILKMGSSVNIMCLGVADSATNCSPLLDSAYSISKSVTIPYCGFDLLLEDDVEIPDGASIHFLGGKIKPSAGVQLKVYGNVWAGDYDHVFQITDYNTNIRWLNGQRLLATWYGAQPNVVGPDAAAAAANHLAFQVAIYSFQNKNPSGVELEKIVGGYLRIPRGDYELNQTVYVANSSAGEDPNAYSGLNRRQCSIIGDEYFTTRIYYTLTDDTLINGMFRVSEGQGNKISGIYLSSNVNVGTYPDSYKNKYGIRIDKNNTEAGLEDVRIQQYERGLRLNGIKDFFADRVIIDSCIRYAVNLQNNASGHFSNCDFFKNDGGDQLLANGYVDPDKHGVIGMEVDSGQAPAFAMFENCHFGLLGNNANILWGDGALRGVHMVNCRAARDDGDGEYAIKAKNIEFYVTHCNFGDFGAQLIGCSGTFDSCHMGKSKVWNPGVMPSGNSIHDIIRFRNITFDGTSTEGASFIQANKGVDYEGNLGTEGKIEVKDCHNIIRTTAFFAEIYEVEYANIPNNYLWNIDGTYGIYINTDLTNAQFTVTNNTVGEFCECVNGVYAEGDNTHLGRICLNDVSFSTGTGVVVSGTNSGSWLVANNLDATII